jgi:hypothetical protein
MKSFKKQIRNLVNEKIAKIDDQLHEKNIEAQQIFNLGNLDWPRVGELAQQVNILLKERALLNELAGFKTKRPKEIPEK